MLAALIGFVAPHLPSLIGLGKGWMDHKQEMQMMELRYKYAEKEAGWRMAEIETTAAATDIQSARKQRESYGVQILNAARDSEGVLSKWTFGFVFLLFSALDWFISSVRPTVTYYVVGLWGAIKLAIIVGAYRESGDWVETLMRPEIWTRFDEDVLVMILAFWFSDATLRRRRARAR